ncbi:hypothetical protein [Mycobacterium sp. 23]|uniref:hypothetical protein n=1 Tax=Mycobacterium sp. 23 TaxID=3400424 RepID=UPI003AB0E1FE
MTNDRNPEPEFEGLNLDDPVRRAQFTGHLELMNAAWAFLHSAVRDGDLRSVWGLVHESLRAQLAQQWVIDNRASISAGGFDESEVAAGLAADPPSHPLWVHFERVHVRGLRRVLPDSSCWGIGAETRMVGPDLEALYVHDMRHLPADGLWQPGAASLVYPLVFQRTGDQWQLAVIGPSELTDE